MINKNKEFASLTVPLHWKLFFDFPKKAMGILRRPRFSSANPACSLRFPITSHAGKTASTYIEKLNNSNNHFFRLKI